MNFKIITWMTILCIVFIFRSSNLYSCSVVYYANNTVCLVGNNEDNFIPYAQISFYPAENGKHGRVFWGYYPNNCPDFGDKQGGMNEQGLFFDGLSLPPKAVLKSADKPTYLGILMEKVLEECKTVDEAINLIQNYNLSVLTTGQTFIADKYGDAAIIEGDTIIRKNNSWLAATNFRLSEIKNNQYECPRYNTIQKMLDTVKTADVEYIRTILDSVSQKGQGPTIYSNICDLKNNNIYFYHFHDFNKSVKLSLSEELKKGRHTIKIEKLFSENQEYIDFEQKKRKDFDKLNYSRQKLYRKFQNELFEKSRDSDSTLTGFDILESYNKKTGGRKGKEYLKTLTIHGEINSKLVIGTYVGDFTGTLLGYKKNNGKYYERIELDGLIIIESITNGELSWSRNSYHGYKFMSNNKGNEFKISALMESTNADLFTKIDYLGDININGHECYKVVCTTKEGYSLAKYIDKVDGLLRAELSVINDSLNGPTKTWSVFENYYNRMYFPNTTKIEITRQTPFAIETSILNIDLTYIENGNIDEQIFNLPKELIQ